MKVIRRPWQTPSVAPLGTFAALPLKTPATGSGDQCSLASTPAAEAEIAHFEIAHLSS